MVNKIEQYLKGRNPKPEGEYRSFGVLLPLIYIDEELHIIFEVRSHNLNTQPGEICFPGGGIEIGETPLEGSMRETCEELNISLSNIDYVGDLDYVVTPFNLILHPFIGVIKGIDFNDIDYSRDEVDSIFTIPLKDILSNGFNKYYYDTNISMDSNFPFDLIPNGKEYNFRTGKYPVYFYHHGDKMVWGMTARILHNFIEILNE